VSGSETETVPALVLDELVTADQEGTARLAVCSRRKPSFQSGHVSARRLAARVQMSVGRSGPTLTIQASSPPKLARVLLPEMPELE